MFKSAIMQHAAEAEHHFRTNDVKVLSRESNWHERGIRESIYIRALSPTLNRNEGRHTLPHCYDSLIKKVVKKPSPPIPHQPDEAILNTARRPPGRPRNSEQTLAKSAMNREQTVSKTIAPTHTMTTHSKSTPTNHGPQPP